MKLTKRMERLRQRLFDIEFNDAGTYYFEDTDLLEIYPELKGEPLVIRKAYAQLYVAQQLPVSIKEDELVVGNPNQNSVAWGWTIPHYSTKAERERAMMYELDESSIWGHHPPQYDKIIDTGVRGVKDEISAMLNTELAKETPDKQKTDEWRAMLIALEYARRYAAEALKAAESCPDTIRRKELYGIYEACRNVPENPARNFQEALQSYWFTYAIINSTGEFSPIARSDQYLYPYYKRDITAGLISEEYAADLIASFLLKFNERIIMDTKKAASHFTFGTFSQGKIPESASAKPDPVGFQHRALNYNADEDDYSEANYNYGQSGNSWLMNCIVGGLDAEGNDATNELSYMLLDIRSSMKLLMPTMSARIHRRTPDAFLDFIAGLLRSGESEPMIYNDDVIIPGFTSRGVPVEEARGYSNDGCWECLIPGKSHLTFSHIIALQVLELTLFRGTSLKTGLSTGIDTGDPLQFGGFGDFYAAFIRQMEHSVSTEMRKRLDTFGLSFMIAPDPLFSALMDDCIEKGADLTQNGPRYMFHMMLMSGLANTADSLYAIKKLIYDDNTISMEELTEALRSNWEGHERLRALILNTLPHFGNDDDGVDGIAERIINDFNGIVERHAAGQDIFTVAPGIGTFENYAVLGRLVGASPDGRHSSDALAPNYSPVPGMDKNGPTSVIKSITKADISPYFLGCPIDISVNANEFEGEAGSARMRGIIRAFCDLGGIMMTVTCNNADVLKDAKAHPEKHRSLRVRLGGFSAYFTAISPVQQDNIIQRFSR